MMTSMTPFDVPLTVVVPHDTVKTKKTRALPHAHAASKDPKTNCLVNLTPAGIIET